MFSLLVSLFMVAPSIKPCNEIMLFAVNSVSFNPPTPLPGEKVALQLNYTVPFGYIATAGTVRYELTYNFLPLAPTVEPLCQNIPCPLSPGTYENSTFADWPKDLVGTLKTKIIWKDILGVQLLCLNIDAKL